MALTDRTTQAKQERIRRLYRRQLDGLSARALVYDHAEKEQVSIETAWRDWREVKLLVDEDWQADRDNMLARLQHMRTKLFHQALKKGQLQTASQVLDSIGRVIGESVETVNIQAPELKISIVDQWRSQLSCGLEPVCHQRTASLPCFDTSYIQSDSDSQVSAADLGSPQQCPQLIRAIQRPRAPLSAKSKSQPYESN